ncbi:hypothetical protein GCM10028778_19060 [Barrientosiimonas marina]|uniref:Potassium channel family protein n=2 Tax=Lentibacillus kimchii TaxID=1542911 RepID=A0ABW2USL6_9BACI
MNAIAWAVIISITVIMVMSLVSFIRGGNIRKRGKDTRFSAEIFYTLLVIYLIVLLGFGLVYFVLSMNHVLLVDNAKLQDTSITDSLMRSFYFSGVTLMTIGYGDITPIGFGRFIAVIQALIGYILPAAFVLNLVQTNQNNGESK